MYKGNSQNMQRRASRIGMKNIPSGNLTPDQMNSLIEERRALAKQKHVLSNRVMEIKARLGIKQGVMHKEIKGGLQNTSDYRLWGELATAIADIEKRLKELPRIKRLNIGGLMLEMLKKYHPEIFDQCKRYAEHTAAKENILLVEDDEPKPTPPTQERMV